jgi:hypothetical protein
VRTKSVQDCVQFYYMWKKVCADDYRRVRLLRRRRDQDTRAQQNQLINTNDVIKTVDGVINSDNDCNQYHSPVRSLDVGSDITEYESNLERSETTPGLVKSARRCLQN